MGKKIERRPFAVGELVTWHGPYGTQWPAEVIYPGPGNRTVVKFLADCADHLLPHGVRHISAANTDLTF